MFKASRGIEDIYELTYIRKDGSRFPAVVSVTALRDDEEKIIGYLLIGTDNTARKQAEEALLKAGALQSAIFNSANFSSIATDAKGVIQIFNVGAERMLGYAAADVMNKITPAEISDPQEVIARAKALSAELGTPITPGFEALVFKASRGIEDIYELTYIRKDGSRFPAVVSVTALRDAHDAIIGYLLIGTDNTARKQVEAEQKKLDQRLRDQQFYTRSLIESNIDALMTTDPQGIITDVNKQMEALTDCTRDELIGAPFKNYFTDPERAEAGIKLVLSEKKVTDYELTACSRDGKKTDVSYNATTFYDRDRTLQGVFAAARDVTDRKRVEEKLKLYSDTLEHRKAELERLQTQMVHSEKMASLGQLAAGVAHELNNPAGFIYANMGLLQKCAAGLERLFKVYDNAQLPAVLAAEINGIKKEIHYDHSLKDLRSITSDCYEGAERIRDVVQNLRLFSRLDEAEFKKVDLHEGIESTIRLISQYYGTGRITLERDYADLPPVDCYAGQLNQVWMNLLVNAAQAISHEGKVRVATRREKEMAVISISDTGSGIGPEHLKKIFDPFFTTKPVGEGTGLGLSITYGIIERHDGSISIESRLGEGTTITVAIPINAMRPDERAEQGDGNNRLLPAL